MAEKRYVCTGSCGGMVTEEEYKQGKNRCSVEGCTKHGQPLEEREYCPECKQAFKKDEKHCHC